jgi:hypothetical protein
VAFDVLEHVHPDEFGGLILFARNIWTRKVPASTPASWLMWTIMDALLLVTTLANHKPGWLPGAWTLGAGSVTAALIVRGKWLWSYKETISAIGAAIATYIWLSYGAMLGLIAGIVAMNTAGIPNFIDLWKNPIRGTWPVWGFTVLACFCTLLGSDWSLNGTILALTSAFFNGLILCVVLFKKPTKVTENTCHRCTRTYSYSELD